MWSLCVYWSPHFEWFDCSSHFIMKYIYYDSMAHRMAIECCFATLCACALCMHSIHGIFGLWLVCVRQYSLAVISYDTHATPSPSHHHRANSMRAYAYTYAKNTIKANVGYKANTHSLIPLASFHLYLFNNFLMCHSLSSHQHHCHFSFFHTSASPCAAVCRLSSLVCESFFPFTILYLN